ncbi:unnamed protein product [Notodromas monacha]|uniref:GSKIP domain-containing protein n=1 Tax=Notodromas monacha TaxID=399045 RepID=A0A7R9GEH1_9CRUS|nr:unnamed protein product [Notodromas monacha]CAG0917858.1 unnamed protein product [Notodromas monacha]
MSCEEEKVLCKEQWRSEANAVIQDVSSGLLSAAVSEVLEITDGGIYINVSTLEGNKYCIELSPNGFAIVGNGFDVRDLKEKQYFETPYSLLDSLSPMYRENFYKQLSSKLEEVQKQRD